MLPQTNKQYKGQYVDNGNRKRTEAVIVHYTGPGGNGERGTVAGVLATFQSRRTPKSGQLGYGYHFVIDQDGTIYEFCNTLDQWLWHAGDVNSTTVGVSLLAVDEGDVTEAQITSGVALVKGILDQYGKPYTNVFGHGELDALLAQYGLTATEGGGKAADEGSKVTTRVRGSITKQVQDPIVQNMIQGRRGGVAAGSRGTRSDRFRRQDVFNYAAAPTGQRAPTTSLSPFLGSLESFHPNIQYELTRRRIAANTANVYYPYVKLTSLVAVQKEHLVDGVTLAWCPSLGIHGEDDISFEDMYLPQNNQSVIGYALTTETANDPTSPKYKRVPVVVPAQNVEIQTNSFSESGRPTDPHKIPIPGIVDMTAERSTAGPMGVRGGLMKAELKIQAYSVGQLDTLLTYYLRPATRVVLEWGRMSSDPTEKIQPFDWEKDAGLIGADFASIISNPEAQTQFVYRNVYANNGNYEIFVGYVVKFDVKYSKTGIYEITLTIHSVQQFELPTIHTGVRSLCSNNAVDKCKSMDIREYFDEAYSWKPNSFKQLLSSNVSKKTTARQAASTATRNQQGYGDHIVPIKNTTTTSTDGGGQGTGLDDIDYYVSWQFFVDKILNDTQQGIISVIPRDGIQSTITPSDANEPVVTIQELLKLGLLRSTAPVAVPGEGAPSETTAELMANEVGYHPDLRSTDPNVMVIYNSTAQSRRSQSERSNFTTLRTTALSGGPNGQLLNQNASDSFLSNWMNQSSVGEFRNIRGPNSQAGSAQLLDGVWINTKAIKQAFSSADTVSTAINSLLSMMNAATQGYWNLQLYSTDRLHSGMFVVDMGLSKRPANSRSKINVDFRDLSVDLERQNPYSILRSVTEVNANRYSEPKQRPDSNAATRQFPDSYYVKPKYIYMFNRGTERLTDGELGSDLIDLTVDFSLPQVIAVQAIAGVGGPTQKSSLNAINIKKLQEISLIKGLYAECSDDCRDEDCRNPQGTLRSLENDYNALNQRLQNEKQRRDTRAADAPKPTEEEEKAYQNLQTQVDRAKRQWDNAKIAPIFGNTTVIDKFRELAGLGTLLELVEFNPAGMMRKLNLDSTNAEENRAVPVAHAFNSSNLTKTTVSLTTPGIGGIELFQSFVVDRVPSILKRGYYIVTKVAHKFSLTGGWTTTIEGRFRYDPTKTVEREEAEKNCVQASPAPPQRRGGAATVTRPTVIQRLTPAEVDAQFRAYKAMSGKDIVSTRNEIFRQLKVAKCRALNTEWGKGDKKVSNDSVIYNTTTLLNLIDVEIMGRIGAATGPSQSQGDQNTLRRKIDGLEKLFPVTSFGRAPAKLQVVAVGDIRGPLMNEWMVKVYNNWRNWNPIIGPDGQCRQQSIQTGTNTSLMFFDDYGKPINLI